MDLNRAAAIACKIGAFDPSGTAAAEVAFSQRSARSASYGSADGALRPDRFHSRRLPTDALP